MPKRCRGCLEKMVWSDRDQGWNHENEELWEADTFETCSVIIDHGWAKGDPWELNDCMLFPDRFTYEKKHIYESTV